MKLYFAHAFDMWQKIEEDTVMEILKLRGHEVINPFIKEYDLIAEYGGEMYYDKPTYDFAHAIVRSDHAMLEECDGIFAWFIPNTSMIGSAIEVAWANEMGKHIIALADLPHPFLITYADTFYLGMKNFIKNKIYKQGDKID